MIEEICKNTASFVGILQRVDSATVIVVWLCCFCLVVQ